MQSHADAEPRLFTKIKNLQCGPIIFHYYTVHTRIADSNVVDLVSDLIRDRKTVKGPKGWSELSQVLVRNNIPKSLIPNTMRRESLSRVSTSVDTSSKERLKQKTLPLYAKLKNPPNRRETVKRKTKANIAKPNISTLADSPITTWLESA